MVTDRSVAGDNRSLGACPRNTWNAQAIWLGTNRSLTNLKWQLDRRQGRPG